MGIPLKVSKYNYSVQNDDGELLIYNSLNYKFLKTNASETARIQELINNKNEYIDSDKIPEIVKKSGIFIPYDCDELSLVNNVYMDTICNDGVLSIFIVLTSQCNCRCAYCFENFEDVTLSREIQDNIIAYVKNNIFKYKGLQVYWFGGEPLLALDEIEYLSKEFLNICNKSKKAYFASISTNGYFLTEKVFRKLLDWNVINYQITVDGIEETHNMHRIGRDGKGTFSTIVSNLISIRDNIKYGFYEISIRTNFTKAIYERIDEYIAFLNDNFSGHSKFKILPRSAVDLGGEKIRNVEDTLFGRNFSLKEAVFEKFIADGKNLNLGSLKVQLSPGNSICYAYKRNHIGIDVYGRFFKCNTVFQSNPEFKVGEITDGKFAIDSYEENKWIKNWQDIDDACKECFVFPVCLGGGCSLAHYQSKYQGYKKKANCLYEKSCIDSIMRLLDKAKEFVQI